MSGEVQSLDKKIADRLICTHNLDTSIYLPMLRAEVEPSPKRACLSARRQLTFTATEPEVQVRKHVAIVYSQLYHMHEYTIYIYMYCNIYKLYKC